jgi:hypothetical protein
MTKFGTIATTLVALTATLGACSGESKNHVSCGGGEGSPLAFCKQVPHYEAGYGQPDRDSINVECIVGPEGADVYESPNGKYYASGTYKLGSFSSGEIELNWGGSTSYAQHETFTIPSQGSGRFSVMVDKTKGGDGNLFFSMSSGSMWMFDTVPINRGCGTTAALTVAQPATSAGPAGPGRPRTYDDEGRVTSAHPNR